MYDKRLLEIRRQLVHSLGMFAAPLIAIFGIDPIKSVYAFVLVIIVVLNFYRQTRSGKQSFVLRQYYIFEKWAEKQLSKYERKKEFLKGPIFYFLGSFLTMSLFSSHQVIPAILVLSICDGISTIVGIMFGKHKHLWNNSSSWEGTLAFFISALGILVWFTHPWKSVLIAGAVSIIESLPIIDDNISIPLSTAFLLGAF